MPTSAAYRILDTDIDAAHERDRARSMGPEELIALIEASGLRGGGAGFPLARKLTAQWDDAPLPRVRGDEPVAALHLSRGKSQSRQ